MRTIFREAFYELNFRRTFSRAFSSIYTLQVNLYTAIWLMMDSSYPSKASRTVKNLHDIWLMALQYKSFHVSHRSNQNAYPSLLLRDKFPIFLDWSNMQTNIMTYLADDVFRHLHRNYHKIQCSRIESSEVRHQFVSVWVFCFYEFIFLCSSPEVARDFFRILNWYNHAPDEFNVSIRSRV